MSAGSTVCLTCGCPAGDPPVLNRLPSGEPCPSCRDRTLEVLPALLPGLPVLGGGRAGGARDEPARPELVEETAEGDEEVVEEEDSVEEEAEAAPTPRFRIVPPADPHRDPA